jgi:hypothetical protein
MPSAQKFGIEALQEIATLRNLDAPPPVAKLPVNMGDPDPDPAGWSGPVPEACPFKELDREANEWVFCALPAHGPKIKHLPGRRINA